MKKLLFTFSLFLLSAIMLGQIKDKPEILNSGQIVHFKRDFSISASPDILFNSPNGNIFAGGLKIRLFVGERFSFDSDILIGRQFVQIAPGVIGIPAILLGYQFGFGEEEENQTLSEILIMGALIVLSVEHFAYHIPVKSYMDISPYMSLLRFRQFTNVTDSQNAEGFESSPCFAVGLEVNKYFGRFILSPYVDYSIAYSGPIRGFTCGINFGYYFTKK